MRSFWKAIQRITEYLDPVGNEELPPGRPVLHGESANDETPGDTFSREGVVCLSCKKTKEDQEQP